MAVTGTPLYQMKAELFKSIGHPIRIRVLELLSERDHAVHELLERIEVEQAGLSQHLAVLRRCGLVRQQRTAGQVIYSVTGDEVTELLGAARRFLHARAAESERALSTEPGSTGAAS
ncbi:MAG: metalloregulator ArsR/SmtB family transcription factor [Nocardioides sp.]|jgi:ArsR family transcriptional regulator